MLESASLPLWAVSPMRFSLLHAIDPGYSRAVNSALRVVVETQEHSLLFNNNTIKAM